MRVMQSFSSLRETTNPYLKQLFTSLQSAGIEVTTFSWSEALRGRFDILHIHWPEVMVRSGSRLKTYGRRLAFAGVLLRVASSRRRLVRTLHNVAPHEDVGRIDGMLLRWCDRLTSVRITLTEHTPVPAGVEASRVTILHGDYRAWFREIPVSATVPGRILYFGLVRPYKGVEDLIAAFRASTSSDVTLRIVGSVSDADLARRISAAAAEDTRIGVVPRYVGDVELAAEVGQAELVVLPYRNMHNSGAALLALSLDRPILIPRNAVTADLAAEVGPEWVLTFEGLLTPAVLEDALARVRPASGARPRPNLAGRQWDGIAAQHRDAYQSALSTRRR